MSSNETVDGGDAVSAELAVLLARLGELATAPVDDSAISGPARIDRIALYEQLRAALVAAQHTEMVAFARTQVDEQSALIEAGRLDPRELGRGIAEQIALAAHVSPPPAHAGSGSPGRWPPICPRPAGCWSRGGSASAWPRRSCPRPATSTWRPVGWWTSSSPRPASRTWGSPGPRPP